MKEDSIQKSLERFEIVIREQLMRLERMNSADDFVDFSEIGKIVIGICGGDGIGPVITNEAYRVLRFLLKDEESLGRIGYKLI